MDTRDLMEGAGTEHEQVNEGGLNYDTMRHTGNYGCKYAHSTM